MNSQAILDRPVNGQALLDRPINSQDFLDRPMNSQALLDRPMNSQALLNRPMNSQALLDKPMNSSIVKYNFTNLVSEVSVRIYKAAILYDVMMSVLFSINSLLYNFNSSNG